MTRGQRLHFWNHWQMHVYVKVCLLLFVSLVGLCLIVLLVKLPGAVFYNQFGVWNILV